MCMEQVDNRGLTRGLLGSIRGRWMSLLRGHLTCRGFLELLNTDECPSAVRITLLHVHGARIGDIKRVSHL